MRSQEQLYKHWESLFLLQKDDFRVSALNSLVMSWLPKQGSVLDLGCGAGALSASLLERGYKVDSLDESEEMLAMARLTFENRRLPNHNIIRSTLLDYSSRSNFKYDIIVCLDVIEHIQDDLTAMNCILKMLKGNGILILSVPAMPSLYGEKDTAVGHYRRYTETSVAKLITLNEAEFLKGRYWNFLGVPVVWISNKIFHKAPNENFRKSKNKTSRWLNSFLKFWFNRVENRFSLGFGLTYIGMIKKIG